MKDSTTMAFVNMYAVLGTLENLCELDAEAQACLTNEKPISIGFNVKGGPKAVLRFENKRCKLIPDSEDCDIRLPFSSPEKFNGMIDGTVTPIPSKGFLKVGFLLKDFIKLTDRLSAVLRATPEQLENPEFKRLSTTLMCYTIASAIAQIGNHDFIGKFSAHEMAEGQVAFEVEGGPAATIVCDKNHVLSTKKTKCSKPRAYLKFNSMEIARNVFDDKENSMACVCEGKIIMLGLISMVDNVNRILDRVPVYLR